MRINKEKKEASAQEENINEQRGKIEKESEETRQ